MKKNMIKKFGF